MSGSTAACQYVAQKKAVYAAIWDGQPAIAKCYSTSKFMRSAKTTESQPALKADHNAVMQRRPAPMREGLYQRHPDGFEFFPSLLTHGPMCSSLFLAGLNAQSITLSTQWSQISITEKLHIKWQLRKAVQVSQECGVCLCRTVDAGKHNVLYAPSHGVCDNDRFRGNASSRWDCHGGGAGTAGNFWEGCDCRKIAYSSTGMLYHRPSKIMTIRSNQI